MTVVEKTRVRRYEAKGKKNHAMNEKISFYATTEDKEPSVQEAE